MTQEEIIKLAQAAGFNWPDIQATTIEQRLERFASLVAATEREKFTNTQEFVTLPREIVEQALDALFMYKPMVTGVTFQHGLEAMQSLRAALEQPQVEQEPAWYHKQWSENDNIFYRPIEAVPDGATPLYIHPLPKREPLTKGEQEPVAWLHQCNKRPDLIEMSFRKQEPVLAAKGYKGRPLIFGDIAHPQPKREPLTDMQKMMCWSRATHDADVLHKTEHQCLMDYASEIEAAHNIK